MAVTYEKTDSAAMRVSRPRKSLTPGIPADVESTLMLSTFSTPLNWMGFVGQNGKLVAVYVGHSSAKSILQVASQRSTAAIATTDWHPKLRSQLEAYSEGELVDFSGVDVLLPPMTEFQKRIVEVTRRLAYGQTTSYGELARIAGYPRAARAVGTVMSSNQFPILIPCHRVLAAGGRLGGYSSPSGTNFKKQLLEMESRVAGRRGGQS